MARRRRVRGGKGRTQNNVRLTDREVEVLRYTARGYGALKIAKILEIGEARVRELRTSIRQKLKLDPSAIVEEMVAEGRRQGFIR